MRLSVAHFRAPWAARWALRAVVAAGVLVLVVATWGIGAGWSRLHGLWQVVLVVMVVGCWALAAVAGRSRTTPAEQGVDFALGLVSIAVGLFGAFGATDEGGSDVFFEIAGALLVLGGIALIMVSAAGKGRAQRWRNT